MISARKFIVKGRVQGVGYRYFACMAAARHGIAGTVRNLPDGSVESVAEGQSVAINAFRDELARGPHFGRVDSVEEAPAEPCGRATFDVLP